jgi:hypothetical protein
MKNLFTAFLCLCSFFLCAHDGGKGHNHLKQWSIPSENKTIEASLMLFKDKMVYLEDHQHAVLKFPLAALKLEDQFYVVQKYQQIQKLNTGHSASSVSNWKQVFGSNFWLFLWFFSLLTLFLLRHSFQLSLKAIYALIPIGILLVLSSFRSKTVLGTDPLFIDSAFAPFKPKVKTRWDANYFYIEDLGLPSHPMMKGITAWQQQVPIQQCYVGANAWSIPLNPVIAATPTPTATNFFKGAVALAANGIPIFNALNNRGEDSYLIGELDQYGGHCGRADDYHYHIAPMSLDSINSDILPIAFALDGFAVYASKEPNGTPMSALDANHGHYLNGVYHYHGTNNYPYVVGNMVGVVTKDATDQIIPQPSARAIRPAGTPLNGAAITNHLSNGTNAYTLTYTLGGQIYNVAYNWNASMLYTMSWGSAAGTTINTYNGQVCNFQTATHELLVDDAHVKVYPNPTKNGFSLDLAVPYNLNDIQSISIYDAQGRLIQETQKYQSLIETQHCTAGVYFVKIQFSHSQLVKKLVVQ